MWRLIDDDNDGNDDCDDDDDDEEASGFTRGWKPAKTGEPNQIHNCRLPNHSFCLWWIHMRESNATSLAQPAKGAETEFSDLTNQNQCIFCHARPRRKIQLGNGWLHLKMPKVQLHPTRHLRGFQVPTAASLQRFDLFHVAALLPNDVLKSQAQPQPPL